jgi:hypothetical protein
MSRTDTSHISRQDTAIEQQLQQLRAGAIHQRLLCHADMQCRTRTTTTAMDRREGA